LGLLVFIGFALGAYFWFLRGEDHPPGGRVEWSLYDTTDDGLVVSYYGRDCEDGRHAVVRESDDRIEVTMWVDSSFYLACDELLLRSDVPVTLTEPAGDRDVVDGACLDHGKAYATCVRAEGIDEGP